MKMIMTAAVFALTIASASGAHAGNQVTDALSVELAQSSKSLSPHGIWTGR